MRFVRLDENDVATLEARAADARVWEEEACRIADALHRFRPDHPVLKGPYWQEYFEDRESGKTGYLGPRSPENAPVVDAIIGKE